MPKLFNETLITHVKNVFDNHVEPYNPKDWESLRMKLNGNKNKTIFLFPIVAKAASVALLMGLSVFTVNYNSSIPEKNQFVSIENQLLKDTLIVPYIAEDLMIAQKQRKTINLHLKSPVNKRNTVALINEQPFNADSLQEIAKIEYDQFSINDSSKTILTDIKTILDRHREKIRIMEGSENESVDYMDFSINDSSKIVLGDIKKVLYQHRQKIQNMEYSTANAQENLYRNTDDLAFEEKDNKNQNDLSFGVELASVSTYSTGSEESSLNVGGGFSAAYKISKNLSLSTGVLLAKQSIGFDGTSPTNLKSINQSDYAADNSIRLIDENTAQSEVSFVSIDIPLNIKFKMNKFTFTTGVSSLVYVNEKSTYNYDSEVINMVYNKNTSNYESVNSVENFSVSEEPENFSHFDFAGLINLAVSYDIPLSKGNLAFEPYVKIPVSGLTTNDIKIGTGGLAVRYCF